MQHLDIGTGVAGIEWNAGWWHGINPPAAFTLSQRDRAGWIELTNANVRPSRTSTCLQFGLRHTGLVGHTDGFVHKTVKRRVRPTADTYDSRQSKRRAAPDAVDSQAPPTTHVWHISTSAHLPTVTSAQTDLSNGPSRQGPPTIPTNTGRLEARFPPTARY